MHDSDTVEQLFISGWRHRKKVKAEVQSIFKVLWPEPVLEPYLTYRYVQIFTNHRLLTICEELKSRLPSERKIREGTKNFFSTAPTVHACWENPQVALSFAALSSATCAQSYAAHST
jgi:hypothetical protein